MDQNESITLCDVINKNCVTKSGDDFKHRRTHAFFKSYGNSTIEITSNNNLTSWKHNVHTGFHFITKTFGNNTFIIRDINEI